MGGGPTLPGSTEISDSADQSSVDGLSVRSDDLVEITKPLVLTTEADDSTSLVSPPTESVIILDHPRGPADLIEASEEISSCTPYKLRWSKSKVYIHPTAYQIDNIPGYLGITQRAAGSFYLSWLPEGAIESSLEREHWVKLESDPHSGGEDRLVTLPLPSESPTNSVPNHAFSVPINTIHSLILRPPTLSSWHGSVIINLSYGPTLPLFFHDDESRSSHFSRETREIRMARGQRSALPASWGGEALLAQLRVFADVCPSARRQGLFLINPSHSERDEHSTPLFSDDALINPNSPGRTSILHESLQSVQASGSMDDLTFNILNSFSRLTQNARSAAQMVLSHRLAKPIIPHLPKPIASLANGEPEFIKWSQQAGVEGYDAARVYLAKWASIVAAQGERARKAEVGEWDLEPSADDDDERSNTLGGGFEVIHATYQVPKVISNRAPNHPIQLDEFLAWQDDSGRLLLDEVEGRRRIFQRGVAAPARKEVWMFLLNVFDWTSDREERKSKLASMSVRYQDLKSGWENDAILQSTPQFQEEAHRIRIDCRRTDRSQPYFAASAPLECTEENDALASSELNLHVETVGKILMTYNVWEKDLGYVQGMSDLCAPLYVVCEANESLAFHAFVQLMDKMKSHFLRDQSGMKDELSRLQQLLLLIDPQLYRHFERTNSLNLFFCFRWILINFKREFEFDDVLKIWEALWTNVCGPHSDLFLALAILETHREPMLRYLKEFDEVLKYVNDITMTLDCGELLAKAEVLYLTYKSILETRSALTADGLRIIKNGKQTLIVTDELRGLLGSTSI